MRPTSRSVLLCAALAACAALLVSGCGGGDETITEAEADEVTNALENVRDTYRNRNCEGTQEALDEAKTALADLDLSGDAKKTADELMERTEELAEDCVPLGPTSPEEPTTTDTFEEPTTTSTTDSVPETTETTTTTTETESKPPPEPPGQPPGPPETPPGQDDGGGDGTGGAVVPGNTDDRRKPGKPKKHGKSDKSKKPKADK